MSADSETSIRSSGFHPKVIERAENLQLPALTIGPDPSEMLPPALGQLPSSSDDSGSSSGESDSFSDSSGSSSDHDDAETSIALHSEAEEAAQALQHASLTQSGRIKSRQLLTASESQRQRIYVGQVAQIRARLVELIQRYEDNSELISQWLVIKDHLEEVLRLCGFDPELIDADSPSSASTPPPSSQSSPLLDQSSTLSAVASSATPSRVLLLSDVLSDEPPAAAASAAPSNNDTDTDNDSDVECSVCWNTVAAAEALSFDCGHEFCTECWRQHVEHAINGGDVLNITCMDRSCQRRLLDADVQRLVSADDFARYQMFELTSRMRQNPNAVWCPADNCTAAFEGLQCPACQTRVCPDCKRAEHSGMTCQRADKLDAKKKKQQRGGYFSRARREERRNKRWLQRHTMACIHCSYPIQKNGGCKHVTCSSCHRDFCWSCLRDWGQAGGYGHICMFVSHGPVKHKCYRVVKDIGLIALWTPIIVVGAAAVVTVGAVVLVGSAVVLPVVMLTK